MKLSIKKLFLSTLVVGISLSNSRATSPSDGKWGSILDLIQDANEIKEKERKMKDEEDNINRQETAERAKLRSIPGLIQDTLQDMYEATKEEIAERTKPRSISDLIQEVNEIKEKERKMKDEEDNINRQETAERAKLKGIDDYNNSQPSFFSGIRSDNDNLQNHNSQLSFLPRSGYNNFNKVVEIAEAVKGRDIGQDIIVAATTVAVVGGGCYLLYKGYEKVDEIVKKSGNKNQETEKENQKSENENQETEKENENQETENKNQETEKENNENEEAPSSSSKDGGGGWFGGWF